MRTLLLLMLSGTLWAQAPVMELAYFQAPATHNTNTTTVASNSPLKYFVLVCGWGSIDVDGNPAHYTWTTCENSINDYITTYASGQCAGQCIQLVFSPSADVGSNSSTFTPTYVMRRSDLTVCECPPNNQGNSGIAGGNGCQTNSAGGDSGTASPVPFSSGFSIPYNAFITNATAHLMAASYYSHIASVTFGAQRGGEIALTCSGVLKTFFSLTNATMTSTMQVAVDSFDSSFSAAGAGATFLKFNGIACNGITSIPSTGNYCLYADAMAATHNKYGIGLRVTCARAPDLTNWAGSAPTCGDWVKLFATYKGPIDVQDSTASDPSGGACVINGQASLIGALPPLIIFIMQHRGGGTRFIYESLSTDLNGAYTGGTNACWPSACFTGSCPYTVYDNAYRAASAGGQLGTGIAAGKATIAGTVTIQ